MELRAALDSDWPGIWPVVQEVVAAGETYRYPRDLPEAAARKLWMLTPPGRTVIAVDQVGTVLGTAQANPNSMRGGASSHVAGASFMVPSRSAGRGVGRALGEWAIEWARDQGYRAMQFNAVVETNARAVALWESLGFEVVGTIPEAFLHPIHGYVGVYVMYRKL